MTVASLTPRIREALSVSSSYDAETIPAAIRRSILALLRDYNFPKTLKRKEYDGLELGQSQFSLPSGFRKALQVRFFDEQKVTYTDPLLRRDSFVPMNGSGIPMRYWIEGKKLSIDTMLSGGYEATQMLLFYQSQDVESNEDWMTEDFEDVLYFRTVYWEAASMRKPEVMAAFAPLWQETQRSLAIYLNEIEFDGMEMAMREQKPSRTERYPRLGSNVG